MKQPHRGVRRAALVAAMAMGGLGIGRAAFPARDTEDPDPSDDNADADDGSQPSDVSHGRSLEGGHMHPSRTEARDLPNEDPEVGAPARTPARRRSPTGRIRTHLTFADKDRMARAEEKRMRRRARKGGSSS